MAIVRNGRRPRRFAPGLSDKAAGRAWRVQIWWFGLAARRQPAAFRLRRRRLFGFAGRLLVDQATWTSWYGESVDPVSRCANIGRQVREIAPQTYLLTYTLGDGVRLTRRLTVWQGGSEAGWKILFHQGTVVSREELG